MAHATIRDSNAPGGSTCWSQERWHVRFHLANVANTLIRPWPEYVGIGDESEAIDYVAGVYQLWFEDSAAVDWLVAIIARRLPRLLAKPTPSPRTIYPR